MLTAQMPALARAVGTSLPPVVVRQMMQALGNCNQGVAHRGDTRLAPDAWTNRNNDNGAYDGTTWNPNEYANILRADNRQYIDATTSYNSTTYGDQLFDFATRQQFTSNFFNGGDTITFGGDVIINNPPLTPPPYPPPPGTPPYYPSPGPGRGPAGPRGTDGRDGMDGMDGFDGPAGPPGWPGSLPALRRKVLLFDVKHRKAFLEFEPLYLKAECKDDGTITVNGDKPIWLLKKQRTEVVTDLRTIPDVAFGP